MLHYLMFRSVTGLVTIEVLDAERMNSKFTAEEIERLGRGLPVHDPLGIWADMVVVTGEMITHWEETP